MARCAKADDEALVPVDPGALFRSSQPPRVLATGSRADFEAMNAAISSSDRARPFGEVAVSHDD